MSGATTTRYCEDCGDEIDAGRRRTRCPRCNQLVCEWCWHHVHALSVLQPGAIATVVDCEVRA